MKLRELHRGHCFIPIVGENANYLTGNRQVNEIYQVQQYVNSKSNENILCLASSTEREVHLDPDLEVMYVHLTIFELETLLKMHQ